MTDNNEDIDKELTKAYIGGLIDGNGSLNVIVAKDSSYKMDFTLTPQIKLIRYKPFSVQIVDDWATKNGIYASVRQYDNKYELILGKNRDIVKFLELIIPYLQDKFEIAVLMIEQILPRLEEGIQRESKEGFIEMMEYVDKLKEENPRTSTSKYSADWFREEWDM